jgi:S-adenosylmethionine:tRNA ribosyltransferase-isomerase
MSNKITSDMLGTAQTLSYVPGRDYQPKGKDGTQDVPYATVDFDYELPPGRIAQEPLEVRDSCRLLVLSRADGRVEHRVFTDIIDYLSAGDLLVVNETRVLPARLIAHKPTGGRVEVLLLDKLAPCVGAQQGGGAQGVVEDAAQDAIQDATQQTSHTQRVGHAQHTEQWHCLVKPGRSARTGQHLEFGSDLSGTIIAEGADGVRTVELTTDISKTPDKTPRSVREVIHEIGRVPLPPYITQELDDTELYQTIYADDEHSAAAPTAGLHFTAELLASIEAKEVRIARVRLDVGLDTFRPVATENPLEHHIHTEYICVDRQATDLINETRAQGGRIIAVGTTTTRALETAYQATRATHTTQPPCANKTTDTASRHTSPNHPPDSIPLKPFAGTSGLFIVPGYEFTLVDALITNFHVPRSTLMMMVSAFASRSTIMSAYQEAITQNYRFLSFGDAMLIY